MSERRTQLQQQLKSFGKINAEDEIQKMLDNLSETEKAIVAATDESKELFSALLDYHENEAETVLTYKQFKALESQYIADIKRLTFIVESEQHKHRIEVTIRQYLHTSAKYKPNLFVVDTLLLGLDHGVEDNAPESMRKALFQYFLNHQKDGQLIFVENTKDLPELEYTKNGANVFEFTQGKYTSKYPSRDGFLYDIDGTSNA